MATSINFKLVAGFLFYVFQIGRMASLDFLSNKKVWRPNFIDPHPIINVVTNHRQKIHPKEEYSLKINDLKIQNSSHNFTKIIKQEKSKLHFVEWTKTKNQSGKNENIFDFSGFSHHITNQLIIEQKPKQVITIKKRKIARKVYLKWSKYSSSDSSHQIIPNIGSIQRKNYLMKKYWSLWRKSVTKSVTATVNVINSKNLNRDCSEDNICISKIQSQFRKRNSENNMLKKSILELQKQKIEEQADLIKELELAKLKLEDEKSTAERQILLKESEKCDQKLKSKAKFLSSCNLTKTDGAKYKNAWEFVTKMELRAEERKKKWDTIKERKQKLEEEKLEKLRAEEERKKRIEEEEKRRKIIQIRKEKLKQEEIRKKQEEERVHLKNLDLMVKEHYYNLLMKSTLDSFKHLVEIKKFMIKQADTFYKEKILFYYFTIWKLYYKIQLQRKRESAENFYEFILLQKTFNGLKMLHKEYTNNRQVAIDFYDFSVLKNYYYQWQIFLFKQKYKMKKKEDLAVTFYHNKISKDCLNYWKKLPVILFQEREKEHRIRSWYNKVQEILPDFECQYT